MVMTEGQALGKGRNLGFNNMGNYNTMAATQQVSGNSLVGSNNYQSGVMVNQ